MDFIDTFSYYPYVLNGPSARRVCFVSVYLTRDIFKAKSDDKEDFKSS